MGKGKKARGGKKKNKGRSRSAAKAKPVSVLVDEKYKEKLFKAIGLNEDENLNAMLVEMKNAEVDLEGARIINNTTLMSAVACCGNVKQYKMMKEYVYIGKRESGN